MQCSHKKPEVHRNRLRKRQDSLALLVNCTVHCVNFAVALNHCAGKVTLRAEQRFTGILKLMIHEGTHIHKALLEILKLFFKMTFHALSVVIYPNLPVT